MKVKKVHVIYKTHLDIGFTDLAENVRNNYLENYIPKAIALADKMNLQGNPPKFIWTTGSWIIYEGLNQQNKENAKKLAEAIEKGNIRWHGLPFTTHSELMNKRTFEFGLSISQQLDNQFQLETIAAKMTDIPGHTKAIIPLLAKRGIKYLHIGVNPSSKIPDVPKMFLWKGSEGSEIIVNYAANYGEILELDFLDEVLTFAHTGDNTGPAGEAVIHDNIADLRRKYPDALVTASTLDDFAMKIWEVRNSLPVISEEIGDTWIHGVATDPKKVSHFKELLRLVEKWVIEQCFDEKSSEYADFFKQLILIPEHTWGLDLKKHFADYNHYLKKDFIEARKKDMISNGIPEKYAYISAFAMDDTDRLSEELFKQNVGNRCYSKFEYSWKEQRGYIKRAILTLSQDKQEEALEALENLEPIDVTPKGKELQVNNKYVIGGYEIVFAEDGSIKYLENSQGRLFADGHHVIGRFFYEVFGHKEYEYWLKHYQRDLEQHYAWCISDFSKPGLELTKSPIDYTKYLAQVIKIILEETGNSPKVYIELIMPKKSYDEYGASRKILIIYTFYADGAIDLEINWFHKDANRIPEAAWLEMNFCTTDSRNWKIKKIGEYISPDNVVSNGSRNLHAIEEVIYEHENRIVIEPLDSPLVSMGGAKILKFDNQVPDMSKGVFFNLHNSIWGTNFPMWFEENMKYRFKIKLG